MSTDSSPSECCEYCYLNSIFCLPNILSNGIKVNIRNVFLFAVFPHNWCNYGVVAVADPEADRDRDKMSIPFRFEAH